MHTLRGTLCKSPWRPPSWRLAQEDTRSTPPLSPLTGQSVLEKMSPFQEIVSLSYQSGGADASRGQAVYGRDHVQMPNVVCNTRLVSGGLSNA